MKNEVIICVDDEDVILNSLRSELSKNFSEYTIALAQSAKEALEVMEELKADGHEILVIVSDYIMPEINGDELLIDIHQKYPEVIKIMLTGQANIDGIANAINNANLYRYLSKPWEKDDFVMTIKHGIKSYKDTKRIAKHHQDLEENIILKTKDLNETLERLKLEIQEKEIIQKKLIRIATIDPLTNIYNRRKFFIYAQKSFINSIEKNINLHLIMLDIDFFKKVNDTYGHSTGDMVLKNFVSVIKPLLDKKRELFARFGGEEFLIISRGRTEKSIFNLAQDIRKTVSEYEMYHDEKKFNITVSIGLSSRDQSDKTVDDIIQKADKYLYLAKENGRNMVIDENRFNFLDKYNKHN